MSEPVTALAAGDGSGAMFDGIAARYVLVCRDGSGPFRDDVAVDSIRSGRGC